MHFWLWTGFLALVAAILAVDLGVLNRRSRPVSPGRALATTGVFVLMALAFTAVVYVIYDHGLMGSDAKANSGAAMTGHAAAVEFLSTWLLEYSLSVDNLFVFTLVFSHFAIPGKHQHRVLFWGILGALLLRGLMIGAGSALVAMFHWALYIFGLILIFTAVKMILAKEDRFDPEKSLTLKLARRIFPITPELHGERFFVRSSVGPRMVWSATPLFLVLLVVEATDVVFAVDSIPAAFGQTHQPFIIFTSNVFAIMGLRSLYFALAGLMKMFKHLKLSLAMVLIFVGVKMFVEHPINVPSLGVRYEGMHIGSPASLAVIVAALTTGVLASLLDRREEAPAPLN